MPWTAVPGRPPQEGQVPGGGIPPSLRLSEWGDCSAEGCLPLSPVSSLPRQAPGPVLPVSSCPQHGQAPVWRDPAAEGTGSSSSETWRQRMRPSRISWPPQRLFPLLHCGNKDIPWRKGPENGFCRLSACLRGAPFLRFLPDSLALAAHKCCLQETACF